MTILTFKTPEKSPSENVICLSCLLQIFDDIIDQCTYRGKQCEPRGF